MRGDAGPELGDRVELELVDPTGTARRYYAMTVIPDRQLSLYVEEPPGLLLVVAWGRLGKRPRVRRLPFVDLDALRRKWRGLLAVRRRHGYAEVGS